MHTNQYTDNTEQIIHRRKYERNYPSAICSMFGVAILVVSLFDYRWFWLHGGICNIKYIGLNMFLAMGKLFVIQVPVPWDSSAPLNDIFQFKSSNDMELTGCIDTRSLIVFRLMITLICLAISSSTVGFLLDALGVMRYPCRFIRRNAVCYILSVCLCTMIIGLCFYASEIIYDIQEKTRTKIGKKVDVQFDVAYYLLVLSNCLLLLATAFAVLRKYPTYEEEDFERLIDDWSRREQPLLIERSLPGTIAALPNHDEPPPEYCSEENIPFIN